VAYLTTAVIDPAALCAGVASPRDGALATFVGIVRDHQDGRAVSALDYEAHEAMAEAQIQRLVDRAKGDYGLGAVALAHRLGRLEVGEISVAIAVAAPHREPALLACRWLIDTLKAEVPIFKREHFADGSEWVERR
jgi:molybdopterin synthase catalytic subunit